MCLFYVSNGRVIVVAPSSGLLFCIQTSVTPHFKASKFKAIMSQEKIEWLKLLLQCLPKNNRLHSKILYWPDFQNLISHRNLMIFKKVLKTTRFFWHLTLVSRISVQARISVQGGILTKIKKRTGWNFDQNTRVQGKNWQFY